MRPADSLALVLAGAGVATLVAATVVGFRWRLGLALALELWLAGGLLRLSGEPTWTRLAAAAALVGMRRLVGSALRRGPHPAPTGTA